MKTIKIEGIYTLLSSLSHIGKSIGVDSYLNTQSIVKNGHVEEVFVYSGNALRGALRDKAAQYMLNFNEEKKKVKNDIFYLLFSGGTISGEQKTNIAKAVELREKIPMLSIFGGGIGSAILSGKIDVSDGYPLCEECKHLIPKKYTEKCNLSWKVLTGERSYTRMDDSKEIKLNKYMKNPPEEKKEKKQGEASTQMRYTVETLNAGAELYQNIYLENLTEIELGCLVSAFIELFQMPFLGGKKNVGMGKFEVNYELEKELFLSLDKNGFISLGNFAKECLEKYDEHLSKLDVKSLEL